MFRHSALAALLLLAGQCTVVQAADPPFVINNDGLFNVHIVRALAPTTTPNNFDQWRSVFNATDANPGFTTGVLATTTPNAFSTTVTHAARDQETVFNYGSAVASFPGAVSLASINNNGPGGVGGPIGVNNQDGVPGDGAPNFASNYGLRGTTYIQFSAAGQYTIHMGSDDGRQIRLTPAFAGSAPGYAGFTNAAAVDGFVAGSQVLNRNACCDNTLGTFNVNAGDILALDAFFFEGTGGDYGEISLATGLQGSFSTATFQLLQDNMLGGTIQLGSALVATPEPASIALWGLGGLAFAGFAYRRHRRKPNSTSSMKNTALVSLALLAFLPAAAQSQTQIPRLIPNNDGLMTVQMAASQSGAQPGTSTPNWQAIWNANPAAPGTYAGFNITDYSRDTEVSFDYPAGGGDFSVNRSLASINNNGPGGTGGPVPGPGGGDGSNNYSVRATTIMQFTVGGTYSIAMGSDDGRTIKLTPLGAGSAPGYTGFLTAAGTGGNNPVVPAFSVGNTEIGWSGGTGHERTFGSFTVAAGDILQLDAFYYEGGGGDSGEISLAQGAPLSFTAGGGLNQFQLLANGLHGVQLSSASILLLPEPASIALWSVLGSALVGFACYRARRGRK